MKMLLYLQYYILNNYYIITLTALVSNRYHMQYHMHTRSSKTFSHCTKTLQALVPPLLLKCLFLVSQSFN